MCALFNFSDTDNDDHMAIVHKTLIVHDLYLTYSLLFFLMGLMKILYRDITSTPTIF